MGTDTHRTLFRIAAGLAIVLLVAMLHNLSEGQKGLQADHKDFAEKIAVRLNKAEIKIAVAEQLRIVHASRHTEIADELNRLRLLLEDERRRLANANQ